MQSSIFGWRLQAAIDDYKMKLDDPGSRGAVLFAVCRGKVRGWLLAMRTGIRFTRTS